MVTQSQRARFGIKITTVDPSQGIVRGVMKGDAQERGILVATVPHAFRWPQVGEDWMVEQKNGTWYLDGEFAHDAIASANPGDVVLTAPSGVVRVIGTPDGSGDFTLTKDDGRSPHPALRLFGDLTMQRLRSGSALNLMVL